MEVIIEGGSGQAVHLTSGTLLAELNSLKGAAVDELKALTSLTRWALDRTNADFVRVGVQTDTKARRWTRELVEPEALSGLKEALAEGRPVAIRVPVRVLDKEVGPDGYTESHFDVFIERCEDMLRGRPVYVRTGIIVSNVTGGNARGYRSLVVIDKGPLASLLGDSENPAHTEWQSNSRLLKARYKFAKSQIEFVITAVRSLIRYLTESEETEDLTMLADVFRLVDPLQRVRRKRRGPKSADPGSDPPTPPEPPPAKPARYRVSRQSGGFAVTQGDPDALRPAALEVRVAYDRSSGNPFKRYSNLDFKLDRRPIVVAAGRGVELESREDNRMRLRVLEDEFDVTVTGFDERRDVIVDVRVKDD